MRERRGRAFTYGVRCVFLCLGVLTAGCRTSPERLSYAFEGLTMGTTYAVKVVSESEIPPRQRSEIQRRIAGELEDVDRKMSTYREDSELSRFNRWHSTEPFPVSPSTFEVLRQARAVSELTDAFDVTVGPLVNAWGFGPPGEPASPPTDDEIHRLLPHVGFRKLELDAASSTIRKADPDLYCDLSSIAKGYAVDRVAEALETEGLDDYMVEVGGEVRAAGGNASGRPWRIAVERPVPGVRELERVLSLTDVSLATSGDYRNYYEIRGERISHEIDPRTGYPVRHSLASVSVLDPLCVRADALATALMVLGPDEGQALALEHRIPALFVVRDPGGKAFTEKTSPAFDAWFSESEEK